MLKSNNYGLTEIEAILAIAILSIGILSIATLFPLALKIAKTAEQETVAANLGQAKIEELFSLGYENIPLGIIETRHRLSADPMSPFYRYERETVSQLVDGDLNISATDLGLKRINVTLYYQTSHLNLIKNLPLSILISQK